MGFNNNETTKEKFKMAERRGFFMERGPLGTWGERPPDRDRLIEVIGEDSMVAVKGFTPTRYELGILARYYYEMLEQVELKGVLDKYETIDGIDECRRDFAWVRLLDIERALGEEEYYKAIEKVQRKWDRVFGEMLIDENDLSPCKKCGGKRSLRDNYYIKDGLCGKCSNGTEGTSVNTEVENANDERGQVGQ